MLWTVTMDVVRVKNNKHKVLSIIVMVAVRRSSSQVLLRANCGCRLRGEGVVIRTEYGQVKNKGMRRFSFVVGTEYCVHSVTMKYTASLISSY